MDGISLKKLSDGIIAACREKAKSLPRFSDGDGAIRITFLPQSALGRQLQAANSELAARYEVATKFSDDGNFVTGRTTEEPVDTYSRTAMKIASSGFGFSLAFLFRTKIIDAFTPAPK